ncbi:MAG: hypothetical protein FWC51_01840 [Proteobacteria bacterium]|nr:hypothetical protein [Pseudomonadota bacterium]
MKNQIDSEIVNILSRVSNCSFGEQRERDIRLLFLSSEFNQLSKEDIKWIAKSTDGDEQPFLICAVACVRAVHNKGRSMPGSSNYATEVAVQKAKDRGSISTYRPADECFKCLYHNGCSALDIIKNHENNRRLVATL